jgi:RNA 2',3'-cyclic 3'-phosphodiesterase
VRLFVAAEIGDELAGRAAELIRELQKRAGEAAPRARMTWPAADRIHITIRFIGEVDDARAGAIRAALEPPLDLHPFDLTLAGTGAFPKRGPPRVLWAGIERGREDLAAVERDITSRLAALGIEGEDRPYSPHLTLARVREAAGLRPARLFQGLEERRLGTTRIDAITLFQSRLSPNGPTYVSLLRTPLGPGPGRGRI